MIIGVIGPPCSGKSTVAKALQSQGGDWINADTIAKEQLNEPAVIEELARRFGESVRQIDGTLSRPAIANLVFGDDEPSAMRLQELESVIHPRTRVAIERRIQESTAPMVILDVPLLIESGWADRCTEVWCLKISPTRQAVLLAARGWTLAELKRRERRQLPWAEKEKQSTWVINNDGTEEDLSRRVIQRWQTTYELMKNNGRV